jgi:hypothetical protein
MIAVFLSLVLQGTPNTEDRRLSGRWRDSERDVVSDITVGSDGAWLGVITASPRSKEVGKGSFQGLRWNDRAKRFEGKLIKPEDDQVVDVELWLTGPDTMEAEAKVFLFRKRLRFSRVGP